MKFAPIIKLEIIVGASILAMLSLNPFLQTGIMVFASIAIITKTGIYEYFSKLRYVVGLWLVASTITFGLSGFKDYAFATTSSAMLATLILLSFSFNTYIDDAQLLFILSRFLKKLAMTVSLIRNLLPEIHLSYQDIRLARTALLGPTATKPASSQQGKKPAWSLKLKAASNDISALLIPIARLGADKANALEIRSYALKNPSIKRTSFHKRERDIFSTLIAIAIAIGFVLLGGLVLWLL
jgi:energy-coupling factor transporter transmembrane protein EcfT